MKWLFFTQKINSFENYSMHLQSTWTMCLIALKCKCTVSHQFNFDRISPKWRFIIICMLKIFQEKSPIWDRLVSDSLCWPHLVTVKFVIKFKDSFHFFFYFDVNLDPKQDERGEKRLNWFRCYLFLGGAKLNINF